MDPFFIANQINQLRAKRNLLLQESDKYVLPDFPINEEDLAKVKEYRQKLRDYFNSDDIQNFKEFKLPDFPTFPFLK